jgi:hypothetical protein
VRGLGGGEREGWRERNPKGKSGGAMLSNMGKNGL